MATARMCWLATSLIAIPQKPWRAACARRYGRTLSSSGIEHRAARGAGLRGVTQQLAVVVLGLALVGCSSAPTTPGTSGASGTSGAPSRPGKPGGFYQDDGPPDKVPSDLSQIPDAV